MLAAILVVDSERQSIVKDEYQRPNYKHFNVPTLQVWLWPYYIMLKYCKYPGLPASQCTLYRWTLDVAYELLYLLATVHFAKLHV